MRFYQPTFWCLAIQAVQAAFAQSPSTSNSLVLTPEVDAFINDLLAEWNSPGGISVAVVKKNSDASWNVETKGYGVAKADGTKVTDQTLFPIGSNSKLFDILSTGLLIANQSLSPRISWTTKLASIIPEWELMDKTASADANIVDLMSHRTGLPRHDLLFTLGEELPDFIKRFRYLKPSAELREVWQYTNSMYTILSHLPTAVLPSRPSFAQYVKANILDPLGLNSTTYSFNVANRSGNLADGFARQLTNSSASPFDAGIPRVLPFWAQTGGDDGSSVISGPGGVISNAVDMATWLQALLLGGRNPHTNDTVIPADAIQMVATGVTVVTEGVPSQLPFLSPVVYGGGQMQYSYRGHVIVEHDGSVPGFGSYVSRLPFDDIGLAIMSNDNSLGTYLSLVIKLRLTDQALGLTPLDSKSIVTQFFIDGLESSTAPIQRPENATLPSSGITTLAGIYNDPGYGKLELCLASPSNASSAASTSCKELLANVSTILPGAIQPNVPTLIAKWDKVFGTYVTLTHFDGNIFNLSALNSYPTGNTSEPFWALTVNGGGPTAEFAKDAGQLGFGITGNVWGAGDGIPEPSGNTVKERAEIWFSKV